MLSSSCALGQVVVLVGQGVELGDGDLVLDQRLGLLEQQVAHNRGLLAPSIQPEPRPLQGP